MMLAQVRAAGARTLAVRLTEGAYGHQVEDVAMGALLGRRLDLPLVLVPPRALANVALMHLTSDEVTIRSGMRARLARRAADAAARENRETASPWSFGVDIRRELSERTVELRLSPRHDEAARRAAQPAGVDLERPIACLHARDSGFKGAASDGPFDRARNAPISTYALAAAELAAAGFCVVRIGDPRSTPFVHDAVVDLATSPERTDELELLVCLSARLFVTGDSGPSRAAYLNGAPSLTVNGLNLLGAYPLRPTDRVLPKRVVDAETGHELSLSEMLAAQPSLRRSPDRYRFVDNTPEEIAAGVRELLGILEGSAGFDETQEQFRTLAKLHWDDPALAERRARKGLPRDEFLGSGTVARVAARERLAPSETSRPPVV